MKRSAPMKRTGFKPKGWTPKPAKQIDYQPTPRAVAVAINDGKARMVVPIPKSAPLRDESYRRWVASLPCAHCGIEGYSQAAHGDAGKGMGIKSSDDTCYPACGPRPSLFGMDPGCHYLIGTSGTFSKEERRTLEAEYAARTRRLYMERDACQP